MESEKVTFSVATYSLGDEADIEEVLGQLVELNPDVIALQSISRLARDVVFPFLKRSGYQYVVFDQVKARDRGEVIFTKLKVVKKAYYPFTHSNLNYGISAFLLVVGKVGDSQNEPTLRGGDRSKNVWVATSFLDEAAGCRKAQVTEIGSVFKNDALVVFAGDTNIPAWQNSSLRAPTGWADAWREKGSSDNELTDFQDRKDQIWSKGVYTTEFGYACDDGKRKGIFARFEV